MSITEDHNEDLVPGTEVLLDRATANGDDASLDQRLLLLVPEPNDDPHNPLVSNTNSPSLIDGNN